MYLDNKNMIWQDVTHPGANVEWDLVNWDA
jgi:hypothetical protein